LILNLLMIHQILLTNFNLFFQIQFNYYFNFIHFIINLIYSSFKFNFIKFIQSTNLISNYFIIQLKE
jgi:hypothetical protein